MEELMRMLDEDQELQAMRKEWKDAGIKKSFPLFHFETYIGIDDYKEKVKKELDGYLEAKKQ